MEHTYKITKKDTKGKLHLQQNRQYYKVLNNN
jgi:hypothetical protein